MPITSTYIISTSVPCAEITLNYRIITYIKCTIKTSHILDSGLCRWFFLLWKSVEVWLVIGDVVSAQNYADIIGWSLLAT